MRRLLETEIVRYYDADLDDRVSEEAVSFRAELREVRDGVLRRHAAKLATVRKDHGEIVGRINAELKEIAKRYGKPFKKIVDRHNRLQTAIAEELQAEAPDPELVGWPEPDEGDEDDDPLFDSTRDYVEQIDRFKRHQGKLTTRKACSDKGADRNGGTP